VSQDQQSGARERSPSGTGTYRRDFPIFTGHFLARSFLTSLGARRGPYSDLVAPPRALACRARSDAVKAQALRIMQQGLGQAAPSRLVEIDTAYFGLTDLRRSRQLFQVFIADEAGVNVVEGVQEAFQNATG
jgi:hypothetical protein